MQFISLSFLIYFSIVLVIRIFLQRKFSEKINTLFLLVCNYLFYCFWDYRFALLLLILTIIVFVCSKYSSNKAAYYFGILSSLCILCFFKYFNFFLSTINIDPLNIILPIGISFYTFEAISYLVDVKNKKIEAENNLISFASYLSFFPNILSGPIVRAGDLLTQIKNNKKTDFSSVEIGIQIMAIGYFKKMVIADRIGVFVNDLYARPNAFNWWTTLFAVLSYSIQIYMDFSGYSDIAIGCAKCLGFDFKKNFDLPYYSGSFTEFWRRWHISLSTWFKDYVYIPLGGNKKGKCRQIINILIVMSLSGLWHGANLNYVLWGLINGIILSIEKQFKLSKKNTFSVIVTFILISFTWVFFRAETLGDAITIFKAIFTLKDGIRQPYLWSFVGIVTMFIVTYIVVKKEDYGYYSNYLLQDLTTVKGLTLFLVLVGLTIILAYTHSSPFVYLQF